MKNIFSKETAQEIVDRINQLTPASQPIWEK
jgi:hypothetical protein